MEWLRENWPFIATALGVLGVGARNEYTTHRMEKSLYDQQGDVRLVKAVDCNTCRMTCQENLRREIADFKAHAGENFESIKKDLSRLIDFQMKK